MAKVKKEVELFLCDGCGKTESYMYQCLGCGKAFCYECQGTKAVKYEHAVYFQGSGDGLYCHDCDLSHAADPLHIAYVNIHKLREEGRRIGEEFSARVKKADAAVERLTKERGIR